MQKKTSLKTKFSQVNNKRFYFSGGITSLRLSHPYLKELVEYEKRWDKELKDIFGMEKKPC